MLKGIPASPGIVIGKVFKVAQPEHLALQSDKVEDTEAEIEKLANAFTQAREELSAIAERTKERLGEDEASIFEAHLLLLQDPEIITKTTEKINEEKFNASFTMSQVTHEYVSMFESMNDEYFRERAADIRDVFGRVIRILRGVKHVDLAELNEEVIVVADDLTPSQTASMNREAVQGFLTNIGGKTSHSAIMARTMQVPAVVGLSNITNLVEDEDVIVFDGNTGVVHVNPDQNTIKEYQELKKAEAEKRAALNKLVGLPSVTTDGYEVELAGNIGTFADVDSVKANDAKAVGLYRTEFLFMDRESMPTEDEQFNAYAKIVKALDGRECFIRTLDIGGDKQLDYLNVAKEENPFLGYRAIRICLHDKELFKTQLRAILRASVYGKIGIMFPMISCLEELLEAKEILNECKTEVLEYDTDLKIGMMIEIPSAALMSDILAEHVDFFSLGTNDLTQYTCAVDRMNEKIEHLYNPMNPGLLRLIDITAKNAKAKGVKLAMCGSIAHHPQLLPVWLGMGFDELSMSPLHILPAKEQIRSLGQSKCRQMADDVIKLGTTNEIKNYLIENTQKRD